MTLYRIEHFQTNKGMWNTPVWHYNREFPCPAVELLEDCPASSLPMPDSEEYREHGRQWFSAASDWKMMNDWFSNDAIMQLLGMGFRLLKVEATEVKQLDNEMVYTKESETEREDLTNRFVRCYFSDTTFTP